MVIDKIGILTDSTCDIPIDLLVEYNILVIPQILTWEEKQFRDRIDIQPDEFYERLAEDHTHPHTAHPAQGDFETAYENALSNGAQKLLVITVSSGISGTFDTAVTAAKSFNNRVQVLDSKATSMGLGWQVLAASRASQAGASVDELKAEVLRVQKRIIQFAAINTLNYLQKGGRIGDAARWATALLKVRPIISLNIRTNRVEPLGLSRTYKAMMEMLLNKFLDRFNGKKQVRIAVLHANAKDHAEQLADQVRSLSNPVELLINSTGPVLGMHIGPGGLGLCGYAED